MTNSTWEKPIGTLDPDLSTAAPRSGINLKFVVAGIVILAAAIYLIANGTAAGARYFITVNELANGSYAGQTVRISGAVVGSSIKYDASNLVIDFTIANIPADTTDLAATLHNAVLDPNSQKLAIRVEGQVKPDLLQDEAQAIITGKLGADGVFYANELLLKCPSRYSEISPKNAIDNSGSQ
ncbi:MAG: cytochrome c maturation protein CcmE [Anaerolineae bacterium]|nr:cytochrome c maturation protein CcmE [Anaerolineae bacterium]